MAIFGKKKVEDDYEEEPLEQEKDSQRLTRKFKDLKPENKRKRKEPPKPWGLKERVIVLSIFLVTTLVSGVMALSVREDKLPGIPRIDLSGFNLKNPFEDETITIGKKPFSTVESEEAEKVTTYFKDQTKDLSGLYGLLVIHLDDGFSYGVNENQTFQAASLLKLPLMLLVYKDADQGKINLDTKYVLKNSDKVQGSGTLDNAPTGSIYTYRQLVKLMGKESDRTAYNIMKKVVGPTELNDFIDSLGMNNTSIENGRTTLIDVGTILQNLQSVNMLSQKSRDEIFTFLTNTIYEEWITAGVPMGIKVVHKYGADAGVVDDAAIVLTQKPYILVLMGDGIIGKDADNLYPDISKYIYDFMNNKK